MSRRTGYSLIEMVVVMTSGAVLTGIAITLLCALLRAEGAGRASVERAASLDRLTDQFRRDVHAAATIANSSLTRTDTITLQLPTLSVATAEGTSNPFDPKRSVEYVIEGSAITRYERSAEVLVGQDRFELGQGYTASLATAPSNGNKLISLLIAPADVEMSGNRCLKIDAALAWDLRLPKGREEAK
ncbi:MAG: hypothetical protein LLG00_05515 [Planctomycetaceae bacterium]|nr:hypothetical protein [Planctomycetaceae bacterium]